MLRLVFCTFPDEETAGKVGRQLVEQGLVACVNLIPNVTSIYRWKGQIENAPEVLAVLKTDAEHLPELERVLVELHPYDVPEFVALDPSHVSQPYFDWVSTTLNPDR